MLKKTLLVTFFQRYVCLFFFSIFIVSCATIPRNHRFSANEAPGFLVVAPDRGFLGNMEIERTFKDFSKRYPARLIFVSLLDEFDQSIKIALNNAVRDLKASGANKLVVIPLLLTDNDPHVKKVRQLLDLNRQQEGPNPTRIIYSPAMAHDYRIAQILEDRVKVLSKDPSKERLVVIGYGATNPEEEKEIRGALHGLIEEVKTYHPFKESKVIIVYHRAVSEAVREEMDKRFSQELKLLNPKNDLTTLVVPFHLGLKHTHLMQRNRSFLSMTAGLPILFNDEDIFPHSNISHWLAYSANRFIKPGPDNLGVVVMPHGAGFYYNEAIEKTVKPLHKDYSLKLAFGMADTKILEEAISELEAKNISHILLIRLYDTSQSMKSRTDYVLGIQKDPPRFSPGGVPRRVVSSAVFSSTGGLDADPLVSAVLLERALEISQNPNKEDVILLAHGARSERSNNFWLDLLKQRGEFIQKNAPIPFNSVRAMTIREDWPEKRDKAVAELRLMVQEIQDQGHQVLIVSSRIHGAGPYSKLLEGLEYRFNGKGIAPHEKLTQWIRNQVEEWKIQIKELN